MGERVLVTGATEFIGSHLVDELLWKGYEVTACEGTFYLFPRTPGGDDEAFVKRAADELLLLVPGGTFGIEGHFRIAFCVDERTVDLAVKRLPWAYSFREQDNERRTI